MCLKTLADTHLKLHAFTLAEYCYVASKIMDLNLVKCLIEQINPVKCKEALILINAMYNMVNGEQVNDLIELHAK